MTRVHLFEIEDQRWCPPLLRDTLTELLQWVGSRLRIYEPVLPLLGELLDRAPRKGIVDLGSGAGGVWPVIEPSLARRRGQGVPVLLTDLYPNVAAFERLETESGGRIRGHRGSVDAAEVPEELDGARTLFSVFHHLRPERARRVLEDAARRRAPIGVFEFTERSLRAFLPVPLIVPLAMGFCLASRPVRWRLLLFGVLVPVIPLAIAWDGFVSNLRTYSPEELRELTNGIDEPGYTWKVGRLRAGALRPRLTYLVGLPGSPTSPASRD